MSQLRSARLHWPIRSVQPSHPVMTRSGAMEAWMREPGGWLTQGCVALRCAALCSFVRRRCPCADLNISGGPPTLAAICEVTMQIPMFSYSPRPSQRRKARDTWSLSLLCFAFCRRVRRGGDSHGSQHMTRCDGSGDCAREPGVFIQPLPSRNGIPVTPSTRPENAS